MADKATLESLTGDSSAKKLNKAVVLYYLPKDIGERGGARCGACMMYTPSGNCTAVSVWPNPSRGVCGLYVHGKHMGPDMKGTISTTIAGYVDNGPTHCGNCQYYGGGNSTAGPCEKVAGTVEYHACCNAWERK